MYGKKEREEWVRDKRIVAFVLISVFLVITYMACTAGESLKTLWVVLDVVIIVSLLGCATMEDPDDPNNFDTYF